MMFDPYWWDDVDYSVRAKKAGYHIVEDGRIKVAQKSEMGTSTLGKRIKPRLIERRNYILYLMKHDQAELMRVRWHPKITFFYLWARIRFKHFYPNQ